MNSGLDLSWGGRTWAVLHLLRCMSFSRHADLCTDHLCQEDVKLETSMPGCSQEAGLQTHSDFCHLRCRQVRKFLRHSSHLPDPRENIPCRHPTQQNCSGRLCGSCGKAGNCDPLGPAPRRHPHIHDWTRGDRSHLLCPCGMIPNVNFAVQSMPWLSSTKMVIGESTWMGDGYAQILMSSPKWKIE